MKKVIYVAFFTDLQFSEPFNPSLTIFMPPSFATCDLCDAHKNEAPELFRVLLPTEKKNQGWKDLAVQIQGIWVKPGDWLYADADGMVVSAPRLV